MQPFCSVFYFDSWHFVQAEPGVGSYFVACCRDLRSFPGTPIAKYIEYRYIWYMIRNFASKLAQDIFDGERSRFARKLPDHLVEKAVRLLDQINAATRIETLRVPPSNKLSKLSGDLNGYWRIKIDKQWAIIFKWDNGDAFDVDIVDYH